MTETPPGWYTDPSGLPGAYRWWDGRQWTEALTSDPATAQPPGGAPSGGPVPGQGTPPEHTPAELTPGTTPEGGTPTVTFDLQAGRPHPGQPQTGQPQGGQAQPGQQAPGQPPGSPFPPVYQGGEQYPPSGGGVPVPPPAGAPGPGYVPPTYAPRFGTQPSEILGTDPYLDDEPSSGRSKLVIFGGIGLVVLLILGVAGGYWWINRDDGTPTASDTPEATTAPETEEPEQTPQQTPEQTPEPTDPGTGQAEPTQPGEEDPTGGRLTFTPLPSPWVDNPELATWVMPTASGQSQVTQSNWDGRNNDWVAMAIVGAVPPTWAGLDLESKAESGLRWFAQNGFGAESASRNPIDSRPVDIDGYEGLLVQETFEYAVQGVEATSDTVTLAVVDLGGGRYGAFVGSVPNTHEQLQADIDAAVQSLSVE